MDTAQLQAALREWAGAIGADHVRADAATLDRTAANAGGLSRAIPAVLRPACTDEVAAIVRIANTHRVPLYPVSCGKNWGLGSRIPPRDGTVVVDLGRMNRIREVNEARRYAVIEPGVTQRALHEHLARNGIRLMLNVTGAAQDTSLIGNALERGVGYFASRADSLSGLEVVLGSGRVVRTGFAHYAGAQTAHLCRHGIGPSLDGLFAQSNYGIVTAAGVELLPEPAAHAVFVAKIAREEDLPVLIDALAGLRRIGAVPSVVHVGNRNRTEIVLAPLVYDRLVEQGAGPGEGLRARVERMIARAGFGPWSAVGGLLGTPAQVRAARREVRRAMSGLARTMFLDDTLVALAKAAARIGGFLPAVREQEALLLAVEPLYGLASGRPTDAAMKSVYWPLGDTPEDWNEPDRSRSGLLFCVPVLPADGRVCAQAVGEITRVYAKGGFAPYITLNLVDDRTVECVANLAFDRDRPDRLRAAHACNDELTAWFVKQGLPPYRVGPQSMARVADADDPFWRTVRDLKSVFDPNNVIAPGRYNLV